jgi:hypothetical protein
LSAAAGSDETVLDLVVGSAHLLNERSALGLPGDAGDRGNRSRNFNSFPARNFSLVRHLVLSSA